MTLPLDLDVTVDRADFAFQARPRLAQLGQPGWQMAAEFDVFGTPAPQGSKSAFINKHTGKVAQVESSKKVAPWRSDVKRVAEELRSTMSDRLDGPLALGVVFTLRKPASKPGWWQQGLVWRRTMHWRPAGYPDLSKLVRSTEDAISQAGLWRDDSRVVEYARVAKVYPGEDRDALVEPGARICIWTVPAW